MINLSNIGLAIILDFIIGDPYSFPHPVKLMGKIISWEDKYIRLKFKDEKSLRLMGFLMATLNIILTFFIVRKLLLALGPKTGRILSIYIIYTSLAAKSLAYEGLKVKEALTKGLEEGRKRVAYIVGRDTSCLDELGIVRATIETVAENTSDGVIAPLFYIFILGPAGGLMYKMVNTMDSMIGYKNDKYIDLGRYPAIIDDIFNYIPARITALLMLFSSGIKYNYQEGLRIMKRDRRKHSSPNAGFPEATIAGLLGISLGGPNIYHGRLVEKPYLGEELAAPKLAHIDETIDIMYRSELLMFLIYTVIIVVRTLI